jgi:uncharacterized repeat protein (TIGR03803 family)
MRIFYVVLFGIVLAGCSHAGGGSAALPPGPPNGGGAPALDAAANGYKLLYSFQGYEVGDGEQPSAGVIGVNGAICGTTAYGGANCANSSGCGTVFEMSTAGKERVLYSFNDGKGGELPYAGLVSLKGTLYGTTLGGGTAFGTVFAISPSGKYRV